MPSIIIEDTANIETGQVSFLQLSQHLLFDLEDFQSEIDYIVWYMAIVLNFFMHNASHTPKPGYGKAQKLEEEHKLYYVRSQRNHPLRTLYDQFSKRRGEKGKSILPLNKMLAKEIKTLIVPEDGIDAEDKKAKGLLKKRNQIKNNLSIIDLERGFPKEDKVIPERFSLFISHVGLKVNTNAALQKALNQIAQNKKPIKALTEKFEQNLKDKQLRKKIKKLTDNQIEIRVQEIQKRFLILAEGNQRYATQETMQKRIRAHRKSNNRIICANVCELCKNSCLTVKSNGPGCIEIQVDLDLPNKSKNYKTGILKIILGFFIGLLNYHARLKKLSIHIDQRQSFGFFRPTVASVAEGLRLSLGLEPEIFNNVVHDSIRDLAAALKDYKFSKKIAAMNSEKIEWQAGYEAEYHLNVTKGDDYAKEAFKHYINTFIIKREEKATAAQPICLLKTKKSQGNFSKSPIFPLLRNTLHYAFNRILNFGPYTENEALVHFKHSYWHILLKLYQYCSDAIRLLHQLNDYEVTSAAAEATSCLENILEYLIVLNSLKRIKDATKGKSYSSLLALVAAEKKDIKNNFKLPFEQTAVYFTDSGQQAIATALLAIHTDCRNNPDIDEADKYIFTFDESYFELNIFLNDMGGLKNLKKENAAIAFIDVTQLKKLNFDDLYVLKYLIIDITRDPYLNQKTLKEVIEKAHRNGIHVTLVCSLAKHEELGLDKYSAGKIITLAPADYILSDEAKETLRNVADATEKFEILSYLEMVNQICRDKQIDLTVSGSGTRVYELFRKHGFLSEKAMLPANPSSKMEKRLRLRNTK